MNRSSVAFTLPARGPAAARRSELQLRPSGARSLRSYRWHSSSAVRALSLHLTLCRSPWNCSASAPLPSADGLPVAIREALDLTYWPSGSSSRRSPSGGT